MELTTQEKMGKRYLELRDSGLSGNDAAAKVKAEFDTEDKKYALPTIRAAASHYKKRLKAEAGQGGLETHMIPTVLHGAGLTITHKQSSVLQKTEIPNKADDLTGIGPDITQEILRVLHKVTGASILTEKLRDEFRKIAREEIETAREGQGGTMTPLEQRPTFRRTMGEGDFKTVLKSVRLSAAMWKAAEGRASEDQLKSRGSVNGLIEFLLWEYLGRPGEMVEESKIE